MKNLTYLLLLCVIVSCAGKQEITENEILWDTWGIPHIYGVSNTEAYQQMGWAQMKNHGDLLLKLYGEARGKSSEYWGRDYQRDKLLHQLGLLTASEKALNALPAADREVTDAYVAGINAYATKYPDQISEDVKAVLPVTSLDVMQHSFRVMYLEFLINANMRPLHNWTPGSNAWAVNGDKTTSGNAFLLANPHLPWQDFWLFFEAQITTNDHNMYGATLVGLPTLGIAFNENLGWTHTVNTLDNVDLYELTVKDNQYELDGEWKSFEIDSVTVIQNTDEGTSEELIIRKRSDFGMVIREEGDKAIAVQWPNLDGEFNQLGQWRAMAEANSMEVFQQALDQNALPLFNVVYADKDKNILYHFGGNVPKKNGDWDKWQSIVPTTSSEELWSGYYTADEVPSYVNPESRWIQNANDPPYTSTFPAAAKPEDFASHIAPNSMAFRPQRSARLIQESGSMTLDDFVNLKHDTRSELALRIQDDLEALKSQTDDSLTLAALGVLTSWDATFDSTSTGTVLFINLMNAAGTRGIFETEWSYEDPVNTPDGFKDQEGMLATIKTVAQGQLDQLGSLQVPYGDLFRVRAGSYEFAGNGGFGHLGLFRTMYYVPGPDGKFYSYHGDSYVCATEFGDEVQAKALLSYGNATQPNNPHVGDQLELYAAKQLRDVWFTREAQEANLEMVEKLAGM